MYYLPTHRYAWLTPPRTASRAVRDLLTRNGWERHKHHEINHELLKQCTRIFCTVRSHYDALASWYWISEDERPNGLTADEWFEQRVVTGAASCRGYIEHDSLWRQWTQHAHTIVYYEALQATINRCLRGIHDDLELHWVGDQMRRTQDYRDLWSAKGAQRIYETYRDEIDELGYEF